MESAQRTEPPQRASEGETLASFLQYQRDTLAWKCSELSDDQLRQRPVAPSELSLLGLVRHMTDVERGYFTRMFAGENVESLYWRENPADNVDFDVDHADINESLRLWHSECARSREIVEACESLDTVSAYPPSGDGYSLRWILTHMIEEYARHNGHADLLRERIDGRTGE